MRDLEILDNYVDDREFRNYISVLLSNFGFTDIDFDDVRVSDKNYNNDNDLTAMKNGKEYTIQTFLNQEVSENEIETTLKDMINEHVKHGAVVANIKVKDEIKKLATENNIEIIDRSELEKYI